MIYYANHYDQDNDDLDTPIPLISKPTFKVHQEFNDNTNDNKMSSIPPFNDQQQQQQQQFLMGNPNFMAALQAAEEGANAASIAAAVAGGGGGTLNPSFLLPGSGAALGTTSVTAGNNNNLKRKVPPKPDGTVSVTPKASTTKRKKPRRVMPDRKEFLPNDEQPSPSDVVGGRGGRSNHHPGNRPYWIKILEARNVYRSCASDVAKSQIAQSIKDYVCVVLGGRFLNLDDETKKWFLLPDNVVLDKIKQALRDRYVPYWAKSMTIEPIKTFHEAIAQTSNPSIIVPPNMAGVGQMAARNGGRSNSSSKKTKVEATNLDFLLAAATDRAGGSAASAASGPGGSSKQHPIPSMDDVLKRKIDTLPTFDKARGVPGIPPPAMGPGLNPMNSMLQGGASGLYGLAMGHLGGAAGGGTASTQLPLGASLGLGGMGFGTRRQSYQTGPPSLGMGIFHSIGGLESLSGALTGGGLGAMAAAAATATTTGPAASAAASGRPSSNLSAASTSTSPGVSLTSDDAMKDFIASINATTNIAGATAAAAMEGDGSTPAPTPGAAAPGGAAMGRGMDLKSLDMFNQQFSSLTGAQPVRPPGTGTGGAVGGLAGLTAAQYGNSTQSLDFMRSLLGTSLAGMTSIGLPSNSPAGGAAGLASLSAAAANNGSAPESSNTTGSSSVDFSRMYASTLSKPPAKTSEV